jgi:HAE1 family hydrophobic/amphiphilic exporter-1
MFLAKLSIDRPVMVTMAILVFVVFGAMAYMGMPLNLMPDVELPLVSVMTVYSGAGPREVESQVTTKLEEAVATVPQIDFTQSFSMENASIILVAFELDKDINVGSAEVKDKVDGVLRDLPDGVDRPSVQKFDFSSFPFMDLVLTGDMDPRELYELADGPLRERLSQIKGVAQVSLSGGAKREISSKCRIAWCIRTTYLWRNSIRSWLHRILICQPVTSRKALRSILCASKANSQMSPRLPIWISPLSLAA